MRHCITVVVYVLCVSIIYVCSFLFLDFAVFVYCIVLSLYVRRCTEMFENAVFGPHPQELVPVWVVYCMCLFASTRLSTSTWQCIYTAEFFPWVVVHLSRGNKWLPIQSCAALPHISTVSKIWLTESLWHSWTKRKLSSEPCLQTNAAHFKCNAGTVPKLFALCPR